MNAFVVLSTIFAISFAQRPGYLSNNVGQPELAYRFRTGEQSSTTPTPLGNRLGEVTTTSRIPVDARGDHDLVDRLLTWPRENRPYWLINYEAIERFRNQQNQGTNTIQRQGQAGQQEQQTNVQTRFGRAIFKRNTQPDPNGTLYYTIYGRPFYVRN